MGVSPIESVTIRRLLSHEAGLMGDAPGTNWEVPTYQGSVTANLARATEIGLKIEPALVNQLRRLDMTEDDIDRVFRTFNVGAPAFAQARPDGRERRP